MEISNVYYEEINDIDKLLFIFEKECANDPIKQLYILNIRGYDIDSIINTLSEGTQEDLENYLRIRKILMDLAYTRHFSDLPQLQRRLKKLYSVRCLQQRKLGQWFHKGLELAVEGYIQYFCGEYEQGVKNITLSFIDDLQQHNNIALKSDAFRFLASRVYNENLANSIGYEIIKRMEEYKKAKGLKYIFELEDILHFDDILYVIPPYKSRNLFDIDNYTYKELFQQLEDPKSIDKTKTKTKTKPRDKNGKILEGISKYLFKNICGCHFVCQRKLSDSVEFDLIFRIPDSEHQFHRMFGDYLVIECKDHTQPASSSIVKSFMGNLLSINARGGILISSSGISGSGKLKFANLEIKKAYHRHGIVILTLDYENLKDISMNKDLFWILLKKYESVRFDNSKDY